jgi:hypothetical protein
MESLQVMPECELADQEDKPEQPPEDPVYVELKGSVRSRHGKLPALR